MFKGCDGDFPCDGTGIFNQFAPAELALSYALMHKLQEGLVVDMMVEFAVL